MSFFVQKICTASLDGRTLSEVTEHVFEPGEDLPTSMAINVEVGQGSAVFAVREN